VGVQKDLNLPLISMEKSSSDGAEQMLMIEPEIGIEIRNEKSENQKQQESSASTSLICEMRVNI
jgi:hypothetical protein